MIIITFNLPLKLSPEADVFVSLCQEYAQADPLEPNYEIFGIEFTETEPFSDSYYEAGHQSSTFTSLMGGFVTLYFLLNVVYGIQSMLLMMSQKYSR